MALPEDFRQQAAELLAASKVMLDADDLATNPQKQIAAVVGQVNSRLLEGLADIAEYLRPNPEVEKRQDLLRRILTKNDAIRQAAARGQASGDWSDFDKLTKSTTNGTS